MPRPTTWALEAGGFTGFAGPAVTTVDLTADYRTVMGISHLARYTVTRMIGTISFRADDVPAGDTVQEAAFGIGVFDQNLTSGAHPNPRTENKNWMWQQTVRWIPWTVEASAGVFRQLLQNVYFDIRTQRILPGTESRLRLVVANVVGEDLSADIRLRTLLRLP